MTTLLKDAKSTEDIIAKAGLNWGVHLEPCKWQDSLGTIQDVPNKHVVVRDDIDVPLGIVGKKYEPINNRQALSILDGLIGEGAIATSAGMYNHGQQVFVNLDLGHFDVGDGDILKRRMCVSTAHDGTSSVKIAMFSWRQICSNGLHGWGKDQSVSIRHTRNWNVQMAEARRVLGIASRYYAWFESMAQTLYTQSAWKSEVEAMAKNWFNEDTTKGQNAIEQVTRLFVYGKGNKGKTWWDAYNGLTEYVDHYQSTGRSTEKIERSTTVGAGMRLKVRALQDIVKHVGIK